MKTNRKQDLSYFWFFLQVAKQQGFSSAAKKMDVSRSSIMSNIKNLEERFNIRFINRNTRFFSLTPEGKYLYEQTLKIDEILTDTINSLEKLSSCIRKEIVIKLPLLFDVPEIHHAISGFMNTHEDIIVHTTYDDNLGNLIEEEIDFAIHIGTLPDSGYYSKLIDNFESYIFASQSYLDSHGTPLHPDNLTHHKCINFDHCLTGNKWPFRNKTTRSLELFPLGQTLRVSSERAVVSFAEQGLGIGSGLSLLCLDKIKNKTLLPLLQEWTYPIPAFFIFHSNSHLNYYARLLMDALDAAIKQLKEK
ncbi:LysR family transcriptional regulator [Salmonella enterica subsp. enterica serovar Saintpaul]|nr:LysR family transcriptional regulator [Salmonella enterica subsp. enterica serovar Saintpaul]